MGAEAKGRRGRQQDEMKKKREFVCVCTLIGFQCIAPCYSVCGAKRRLSCSGWISTRRVRSVCLFVQECELEWTHWKKKRQCCFAGLRNANFMECSRYGVSWKFCVEKFTSAWICKPVTTGRTRSKQRCLRLPYCRLQIYGGTNLCIEKMQIGTTSL